jgi:hypothetical protein
MAISLEMLSFWAAQEMFFFVSWSCSQQIEKNCHWSQTHITPCHTERWPSWSLLLQTSRFKSYCMHALIKKKTQWSESASELYRPSDRCLSAKWLPTFVDRGFHVVSMTDPYGRILGFLDRSRYFSIKCLHSCTHEAEWTPFQTHY